MVAERSRSVFLRAEVSAGDGREVVAHTREISPSSVVVQIEPAFTVGERVVVRVSLPRHVLPLRFEGMVSESWGTGDPGNPTMLRIAFALANENAGGLAALLDRLDDQGQSTGEYRVLIVEDSDLMRDLFGYGVRKYFRRQGTRVVVDAAEDGLVAWKRVKEQPYDLLIVDRYLPVLDGARLVERVRGEPELADTLIVGVSGGGHEAGQAMLQAGADLFLPKPVVLRDLFYTLEKLTRGAEHDTGRSQAGAGPR